MTNYQSAPWCWVHELKDYKRMFALTAEDLTLKLLDCAAGPSSVNAELTREGGHIVSCDPLYAKVTEKIQMKTQEMIDALLVKVQENQDKFCWKKVESIEELKRDHQAAAKLFLEDFKSDVDHTRYLAEELPNLSFMPYQFDLALCANFLFDGLYHPSESFIVASIKDMCRVAREARIYPLLDIDGNIAAEVGPVMMQLQQENYGVEIRQVDYQFQKNSNAMLRVWPNICEVP
jgi:hypothetical protein